MKTKVTLDKKLTGGSLCVTPAERHSLTECEGGATSSTRTSGSGNKQLMIGGHPHVVVTATAGTTGARAAKTENKKK